MEVKLKCGKTALIDDDCKHLFEGRRSWRSYFDGWNWYVRRHTTINKKTKTILLHREVMGVKDSKILIDHKDGNGLNNMRCNLRVCTHSENRKNRHNKSDKHTSKYLGVSLKTTRYAYTVKSGERRVSECKRWEARIQHNKKQISIGFFDNEKDAALAYNDKALELHGEFASLNKIDK